MGDSVAWHTVGTQDIRSRCQCQGRKDSALPFSFILKPGASLTKPSGNTQSTGPRHCRHRKGGIQKGTAGKLLPLWAIRAGTFNVLSQRKAGPRWTGAVSGLVHLGQSGLGMGGHQGGSHHGCSTAYPGLLCGGWEQRRPGRGCCQLQGGKPARRLQQSWENAFFCHRRAGKLMPATGLGLGS